jgi:hypothetical protein
VSYKTRIFSAFFFTAVSAGAHAQSLCSTSEKTMLSFQTLKSNKVVSVCRGENSKYLVYRFGKTGKIELQFPDELNENSWKKFEFFGRRRPGGKMNAGFGDYSISFRNGPAEYVVFQQWSDEDDTYAIGVNVEANGKTTTLKGGRKSQQGSLVLLESEAPHLQNSAHE